MSFHKFQDEFLISVQENKLQADISEEIIPIGHLNPDRVIKIYNSDYFARMTEALGETFESVWFVLGDEDFFKLAKSYIINHPSTVKDLANYGLDMPSFIEEMELLEDWPFLRDLAEFELKFWKMFHSDYPVIEPLTVDPLKLSDTKFCFENIVLFQSSWDVVGIWRKRESVADEVEIDWDKKIFYLIYRHEVSVHLLKLTENQYSLLLSMQKGSELGKALESVEISSEEVQELFSKLKDERIPLLKWDT